MVDEKFKKELRQEIRHMDKVVGTLKFHNQLGSSWRRLRQVLTERLKLDKETRQGKLF